MSTIESPAFSLRSRLDEFQQFQDFCRTYQHAIKDVQPSIPLYTQSSEGNYQSRRATTFIYAFFTFNDIYKIDWGRSLAKPNDEPIEYEGKSSQQEQIWNMVGYCFKSQPTRIRPYTTWLVEYCTKLGITNPIDELNKISLSENDYLTKKISDQYNARWNKGHEISMQSIPDFQNSFALLYKNGKQEFSEGVSDGMTHINNVLYFIYLVRCSVFHGRKQLTVATLGRDQDIRLAIYAAAIMAMNQVVIDHARQHIYNTMLRSY